MSFKKNKPFIAWLLCLLLLPGFTWSDRRLQKISGGTRGEIIQFKQAGTDGKFDVLVKVIGGPANNQFLWLKHNDGNRKIRFYESKPSEWIVGKTARRTFDIKRAHGFVLDQDTNAFTIQNASPKKTLTSENDKSASGKNKVNDEKEQHETAPVIEHALNEIEKANAINILFGSRNKAANSNCQSCDSEAQNLRYQTCSDKNDYLENEIKSASTQSSLLADIIGSDIRNNSIIKPACIQMSMNTKFGASSASFRECSKNSRKRTYRPCISENYFKLIHNSFDLVSTCMKGFLSPNSGDKTQSLDIRSVYALINIESGFHINAVSNTGAGGIGQFTREAIEDVNANELKGVHATLRNHPNRQCQKLSTEILAKPMSPSTRSCDRISIQSGNPIKNMIYTYAYLKKIKSEMNSMIFKNRHYQNKFKLSEPSLDKIKRALTVWAHNAGPAGAWTPTKALLNTLYRNKSVTNADQFINELQQYMRKIPASANKSRTRRIETSNYFPSVANTLNSIESSVGGGSCVNF